MKCSIIGKCASAAVIFISSICTSALANTEAKIATQPEKTDAEVAEIFRKLPKRPPAEDDFYKIISGGIWVGRVKSDIIDIALAIYESRPLAEDVVRQPELKNTSVMSGVLNMPLTLLSEPKNLARRNIPHFVTGHRIGNKIHLNSISVSPALEAQNVAFSDSMYVIDIEVVSRDILKGTLSFFRKPMNGRAHMDTDEFTLKRVKNETPFDVFSPESKAESKKP